MPKGNAAKIRALNDSLKVVTTVNVPTGTHTLYLALYQTSPDNNDVGIEANYPGYARQVVNFGTPSVPVGSNVAEVSNTNDIEFAVVPATAGQISYAAIRTELTGGILLYYGSLGATYSLNQGVQPTVPTGNLTIYEN